MIGMVKNPKAMQTANSTHVSVAAGRHRSVCAQSSDSRKNSVSSV